MNTLLIFKLVSFKQNRKALGVFVDVTEKQKRFKN